MRTKNGGFSALKQGEFDEELRWQAERFHFSGSISGKAKWVLPISRQTWRFIGF